MSDQKKSAGDADLAAGRLKSYGRRGGRALSHRQQQLLDIVLPRIRVPIGADPLNPRDMFPEADKIWLEIGFGGGEHPVAQAAGNPDAGLIASEVFFEGIAKCLTAIEARKLENIRLWDEDARILLDAFEPACIDRIFILFPDPWPKARHHKRRLVQPDFLDQLARVLRPGGTVRFATDVADYAAEAEGHFGRHPRFERLIRRDGDARQVPPDHFQTRYETKQLGDIEPVFFDFVCV